MFRILRFLINCFWTISNLNGTLTPKDDVSKGLTQELHQEQEQKDNNEEKFLGNDNDSDDPLE